MNAHDMDRELIIIKLGGAEDVVHDAALDDIERFVREGRSVVIVHGGSAEANRLGHDVGHPPRVLTSPSGHASRYTDPRTLELFVMATALVNRRLVGELQRRGVDAVGVSGLDGALLRGQRKEAVRSVENGRVRIVRDDWSGRIQACDSALVETLLDAGHVPVIAPLAMTDGGAPLNVDGDRAAAAVAGALGTSSSCATSLVLLTGASGLYRAFPDEQTRIVSATLGDFDELMTFAQGRMKRKVVAAREALDGGVNRVIIAAAGNPAPIQAALAGEGTTITRDDAALESVR